MDGRGAPVSTGRRRDAFGIQGFGDFFGGQAICIILKDAGHDLCLYRLDLAIASDGLSGSVELLFDPVAVGDTAS
ncbi:MULTISPECIES: hypothetical protein [Tritonibacter]|uniref:hypothetical protein n=1 Tax=Tritonibacter TaxID=2083206 RepID=UPI000806BF00|nr:MULTISPECIES: hypothetical protein [Tritonibacter]